MSYSLKGKSVFITGGTGFIGSHLARRLVHEGASVAVLARKKSPLDLVRDIENRIRIYHAEITDPESLQHMMGETRPKFIFHLAAEVNVNSGLEIIEPLINVNVQGTVNVLKAAIVAGSPRKIVFFSTSDVYGNADMPYSEDAAVRPVSAYAASKASAELFCMHMAGQNGIPWIILRPFIIYGGGQLPGMFIPQLIGAALKGEDFSMTAGEQTRDFLYVDDLVDACVRAVTGEKADGNIINIASGVEKTLAHVAENVMSLLDHPIKINYGALPYRDNERWRVRADIARARELLGWKPENGLTEGLKKTIQWYKERFHE